MAAVDAPSHLRHPQGAAHRGPRRLRRAPARPAVPRRRLDRLGRPAAPGAPARPRGHDRAGRQVRRPARRLPVGDRGAARRRVRQRRPGQHPLGAQRRLPDPRRRGAAAWTASTASASPAGSASAASRASSARSGTPASTASRSLGLCLGLQCMVDRVARDLAGLAGANCAEFDPDDPAPGHRHHGRPAATWSPASATWAARCGSGLYPAELAEGSIVARAVRRPTYVDERHRHRYEVNNAYRDAARGRPAWSSRGTSPGRPPGRVRRAARRRAPVLRGHPGAPGVPVPAHPAASAVRGPGRPRRSSARRSRSSRRRGGRRPPGGRSGVRSAERGPTTGRPLTLRDEPESLAGDRLGGTGPRLAMWTSSATPCDVGCPTAERGRDVVVHPGRGRRSSRSTTPSRVLLVRQYRHPVGAHALGDPGRAARRAGEPPLVDRRSASWLEEAGYRGRDWHVLARLLHLARGSAASGSGSSWPADLTRVPGGERDYVREHEEAHLAVGLGAARLRRSAGGPGRATCTTASPAAGYAWPAYAAPAADAAVAPMPPRR